MPFISTGMSSVKPQVLFVSTYYRDFTGLFVYFYLNYKKKWTVHFGADKTSLFFKNEFFFFFIF